jgi:hypothetical protein
MEVLVGGSPGGFWGPGKKRAANHWKSGKI